MMPQRHVKEIDSIGLGVVVERVEIERRFPEASFVKILVGPERLVRQFQLAEDRVLCGQERGDRNERGRNETKQIVSRGWRRTSKQKSSGSSASAGNSFAAAKAAKKPAAANRQAESNPVIPDAKEGVNREEHTPGGDGVVVQRLCEGQQIGAERRGDQAEEPRPVAERQAVEPASEQDQKDRRRE